MEKLVVIYKDGGKVIVTCKKNGMAMSKWENIYEPMKGRLKEAFIQRYPKKDNEPTILVS